jgi:hypothetical protein
MEQFERKTILPPLNEVDGCHSWSWSSSLFVKDDEASAAFASLAKDGPHLVVLAPSRLLLSVIVSVLRYYDVCMIYCTLLFHMVSLGVGPISNLKF